MSDVSDDSLRHLADDPSSDTFPVAFPVVYETACLRTLVQRSVPSALNPWTSDSDSSFFHMALLSPVVKQQISIITLGITDLNRSRHFYVEGFGWTPVFENPEIIFYQMNGLVLGTFLNASLEADMNRPGLLRPGAFSLAHNVSDQAEVEPLMERLVRAGGKVLRPADAPAHGGFRGYVTDPDEHAWEIAWNPFWAIDAHGHVTFGV